MFIESLEREKTICCGCGKVKSKGLIVCWTCFKYREDTTPFKYFGETGSLDDWVKQLPKQQSRTICFRVSKQQNC